MSLSTLRQSHTLRTIRLPALLATNSDTSGGSDIGFQVGRNGRFCMDYQTCVGAPCGETASTAVLSTERINIA